MHVLPPTNNVCASLLYFSLLTKVVELLVSITEREKAFSRQVKCH